MATQKQKRARLEEKRQKDLAATVASGLIAQERDRQQRAARAQAIRERAEAENKRLEGVLVAAKINAMAGISHSVE